MQRFLVPPALAQRVAAPKLSARERRIKRQRLVIIRVRRHLRNVFGIGDVAGFVDDEDRAGQQGDRQSFEQHAVVLPERVVVDVGQRLHVADPLGRAEALLREGQVEADRVAGDLVLQPRQLLLEIHDLRRKHQTTFVRLKISSIVKPARRA